MSIYFLLLSLLSFSLSKDFDCVNIENASLDVCSNVSTGTMNKCCYVSYTAADSTENPTSFASCNVTEQRTVSIVIQ